MNTRALYLDDDRVRALLRTVNPMTQMRFAVKLPHNNSLGVWEPTTIGGPNGGRTAAGKTIPEQGAIWHTRTGDCLTSPHGQPGDRFSVREAWCHLADVRTSDPGGDALQRRVFYRADYPNGTLMHDDDPAEHIRWKSSRVMPAPASRITLKVTGVRVERLRSIDTRGAVASGMSDSYGDAVVWHLPSKSELLPVAVEQFAQMWDRLHVEQCYQWDTDPWVWVIEFKRLTA